VQTNNPAGHSGSGDASERQVSYVFSHGIWYITLHRLFCESNMSPTFLLDLGFGNLFGIQIDEAVLACFFALSAFEIRISPKVFRPVLLKSPKLEFSFVLRFSAPLSDLQPASIQENIGSESVKGLKQTYEASKVCSLRMIS